MNDQFLSDEELDHWVDIHTKPDAAQLFRADFERLQQAGITHIHRHYYSLWDGFAERKAAVEKSGLPILQTKRTFSWNEPQPPITVPDRLHFRTLSEVGQDLFLSTVETALPGTLDRVDQGALTDTQGKTLTECVREQWDEIKEDFAYEDDWFLLAYNQQNEVVGFVQLVIYPDCNKGDLQESSIYHIAVLPAHRGHGYIHDILAQSVHTMQQVGVWRIFCDTDSENRPMINAFQKAGFDEEGVMYKWHGEVASLLAT